MRILAISDIHGCYEEFCDLLEQVNYNSAEDRLVLVGDYVDRGPRSREVIDLLIRLQEEAKVIILRGNHDQMMLDALLRDEDQRWLKNGALYTLKSYYGDEIDVENYNSSTYEKAKGWIKQNYAHHLEFLDGLELYYESEQYIFVHAGINPAYKDWKQQPKSDFIWIREAFFNHSTNLDKPVVFGHTPVLNLHDCEEIWINDDKIGIDGACAYGKRLNCLEINEQGEYKSYFVQKN
ncbi:metallophosphoesterase family protein [Paenibacillus sp. CAA11]|uniref:metallophosphoesterase family protein n=1 Tax=Paenibacillus sp. CAA11 TaxID=1532905 RepID=UPI001F26A7C6